MVPIAERFLISHSCWNNVRGIQDIGRFDILWMIEPLKVMWAANELKASYVSGPAG